MLACVLCDVDVVAVNFDHDVGDVGLEGFHGGGVAFCAQRVDGTIKKIHHHQQNRFCTNFCAIQTASSQFICRGRVQSVRCAQQERQGQPHFAPI